MLIRLLIYVATFVIAVACGDGSSLDFQYCEAGDPPANEAYGEPDGVSKEPEEDNPLTITYRWNCVPVTAALSTTDAEVFVGDFLFIQQTWMSSENGCWDERENLDSDPRCDGTTPDP